MKLKILTFGFIIMIFNLSCNETVIEPKLSIDKTNRLKSATTGTSYYVSKTGSDSNAGTLASPLQTIQKAVDKAVAGDIVIVRDGTYTFTGELMVKFLKSGTADNYITIKSENKWGAVLDGLGTSSYCFLLDPRVSYINISGFEIKNFRQSAFYLNNPQYPNTNIKLDNNRIHDLGRECTNTDSGSVGMLLRSASSIIVERNIFYNIGRFAPNENGCTISTPYYQNHDHGLYIDGCNGVKATYNVFYNMQRGWAVHIYSGSGMVSSNISILNNTFAYGNPYRDGGHITLSGSLSNSDIKNNIFYGQVSAGISFDISRSFSSVLISNNIAYGGNGLIITSTPAGVTLSNNFTNTDAKMINPDSYDFRLQSTSPAINTGVNVGLTSDYLGNPIIGLPDIGAYESTTASGTSANSSSAIIGLNTIGSMPEGGDKGFLIVSSFTAGSNFTVNRMNLNVSDASGNARLGIYSNNSGEPGTLLAQTGEMPLSYGWNSGMLGSSVNLTSGGTYWLAIEVNSFATTLRYNSVSGRQRYKSYAYGSLPSTAPTGMTSATGVYSVYADNNSVSSNMVDGVNGSILGLNTVGGVLEKGDNGFWIATSFTAVSNINVNKMNLYSSSASGNARLGIYSSSSGGPGTLIAQTGEIALSNGWNSSALGSSVNLTSGVTYWLAIEVNSSATTLYYNSVVGRQIYKSYSYGSMPSSAPVGCSSGTGVYSIYAN